MSKKGILISILFTILIVALYAVNYLYDINYSKASIAYKVYLNGDVIGLIEDKDKLYSLINNEQKEIKEKYDVKRVYPPKGLDVVKVRTYNQDYTSIQKLYEKIETADDFTIQGYIVTFKPKEGSHITVNVLDKKIFEEALDKFILAFVTPEQLAKYKDGDTAEITEIGTVIQNMYLEDTITIKKGYISVKEKIYTSVEDLAQYLLFGPNTEMGSYTIAMGDDIESVSERYKLNPQEFIIANPIYRDVNTMLKVGDVVNVTLLDPVLTFVYDVYSVSETAVAYTEKTEIDYTKDVGYSEIVRPGVTGLRVDYERYSVKNGQQDQHVEILDSVMIREPVNQIKKIGRKSYNYGSGSGSFVPSVGEWQWPTNQPSIITSRYGMRKGKLHEGLDISGTGCGSPIYAVADGIVTQTRKGHKTNGTFVVISHGDGYYSAYLHLSKYQVSEGQKVSKGTRIGSMGQTGVATGCHIHLGIYKGEPFAGQSVISYNPLTTIFKGIK